MKLRIEIYYISLLYQLEIHSDIDVVIGTNDPSLYFYVQIHRIRKTNNSVVFNRCLITFSQKNACASSRALIKIDNIEMIK